VLAGPPLSRYRTGLQLKQCYDWPGMHRDVDQWYQECVECASPNEQPICYKGQLQKVLTAPLMDIVVVDILSSLPVNLDWMSVILSSCLLSLFHLFIFSVVMTTELLPPSRWLATTEPTPPLRCFAEFSALFQGAVS